ncbi:hypothetical protein ACFXCZ_26965 [Streptomyces sp. NPDC059396]|uniref:hypothetical protein n=1 Tax=Streptomyces sp. NPDC059396 TaxID=3346819 RepID=UPI0036853EBB
MWIEVDVQACQVGDVPHLFYGSGEVPLAVDHEAFSDSARVVGDPLMRLIGVAGDEPDAEQAVYRSISGVASRCDQTVGVEVVV